MSVKITFSRQISFFLVTSDKKNPKNGLTKKMEQKRKRVIFLFELIMNNIFNSKRMKVKHFLFQTE